MMDNYGRPTTSGGACSLFWKLLIVAGLSFGVYSWWKGRKGRKGDKNDE